jgi:hypothetical protein
MIDWSMIDRPSQSTGAKRMSHRECRPTHCAYRAIPAKVSRPLEAAEPSTWDFNSPYQPPDWFVPRSHP